jgi:predicted  nucleic acid-binding Zn-ribbon protein
MKKDLERVVELQRMDSLAAELEKEIATLPKHIAAIEKQLDSHVRKLEADRAVLAANLKERKSQESDIQTHQQKISKLRDQMMSAKTNEQYRAFQHEIEYCEQAIRKCEDRILELMEESDNLDSNVRVAETSLAQEKALVEREKASARERTSIDQRKLAEIRAARAALVPEIAREALDAYDRLRKRTPIAVSDATEGRCSACHLELRPQVMQQLRKNDQLLLCENCHRILYYNPPVAFDAATGPGPAASEGRRVAICVTIMWHFLSHPRAAP